MHYSNLTDNQREFARLLVTLREKDALPERFMIAWAGGDGIVYELDCKKAGLEDRHFESNFLQGVLVALQNTGLVILERRNEQKISGKSIRTIDSIKNCTITRKLFEAVENNFSEPDTSFLTQLTPLADVTNLDQELKQRCLPILGAGSADPMLWDSAVRTAGVILEERLRDVGKVAGKDGRDLVNAIFSKKGTLAHKFNIESECLGYRDLYAGVVGAIRNPSAHKLVDPNPMDGGATIAFIDLLLRKLESLR